MPTPKPKKAVPGGATEQARSSGAYVAVRDVLVRTGMELLTEQGFAATGLDAVLKRATVPKGSFYYYFPSKEAFGMAVMDAYDAYFLRKLDRWLTDETQPPLERLMNFVRDAAAGMAKHEFRRGCLVGNLSQELGALPSAFRPRLNEIFEGWQARVATCLAQAQAAGHIAKSIDCEQLAEFFWIAWEGAVLRARLVCSAQPLKTFIDSFLSSQCGRPGGTV